MFCAFVNPGTLVGLPYFFFFFNTKTWWSEKFGIKQLFQQQKCVSKWRQQFVKGIIEELQTANANIRKLVGKCFNGKFTAK